MKTYTFTNVLLFTINKSSESIYNHICLYFGTSELTAPARITFSTKHLTCIEGTYSFVSSTGAMVNVVSPKRFIDLR